MRLQPPAGHTPCYTHPTIVLRGPDGVLYWASTLATEAGMATRVYTVNEETQELTPLEHPPLPPGCTMFLDHDGLVASGWEWNYAENTAQALRVVIVPLDSLESDMDRLTSELYQLRREIQETAENALDVAEAAKQLALRLPTLDQVGVLAGVRARNVVEQVWRDWESYRDPRLAQLITHLARQAGPGARREIRPEKRPH